MAITNAQQYQQLVNKPANGKRPGYRGPGGYQGSKGSSVERPGGSSNRERGITQRGSGPEGTTGRIDRPGADPSPPQEIIGGKSFDLNPKTKKAQEQKNFARSLENDRLRRERRKRALQKQKLFETISLRNKLMLDPTIRTLDDNLVDIGAIDGQGLTIGGVKVPSFITGAASALTVDPSTKYFDEDSIREIGSVLSKSKTGITKSQADTLGDIREDITMRDRILDPNDTVTQSEFDEYINRNKIEVPDRDGPIDPCKGPNPPAYCFVGIRSVEPEMEEEYVNPLSKLTPRIAGTQFAADGGRIGFFKGAQADTAKGKAMSPGTTASGGFRGGGGDGPKTTPTNIGGGGVTTLKTKKDIRTPSDFTRFDLKDLVNLYQDEEDENMKVAGLNQEQVDYLNKVGGKVFNVDDTGDFFSYDSPTDIKKQIEKLNPESENIFGTFKPSKIVEGDPNTYATEKDVQDYIKSQFPTLRTGGREIGLAGGGIASLDREAFLLGGIAKGLKKAVRGVKKLAKSPIGKAALGAALFKFGGGLGGLKASLFGTPKSMIAGPIQGLLGTGSSGTMGILGKLGLTAGGGSLMPTALGGITLASLAAGAMTPKQDDDEFDLASYYAQNQLNPSQSIRGMGSEFDFYGGQRMRVADGGDVEPVAKKTMPLLDMDGKEKDYRETGGFVDMGRMERADDVPARLSKNEFVFTADAVRNAGEGNIDKGAEVMYNMMKNLEAGGEVSEESQGLEGAREMFQTSQRLGEVI